MVDHIHQAPCNVMIPPKANRARVFSEMFLRSRNAYNAQIELISRNILYQETGTIGSNSPLEGYRRSST